MAVTAMNEDNIGGTNGAMDTNSSAAHEGVSLETEFLIVGAGPAGASLACFLASYGKLER